uniref:YGHL3 n=1 Tax=Seriola quinqueradiata TaxID=8161 RepID=Q91458_SERQU|nr:YGHL3 [Seriola quinqueradiata]
MLFSGVGIAKFLIQQIMPTPS